MALISSWFTQVVVSQDYRRTDYIVLLLILMIGAFVRFWGLGNVSLHGDEETMAMPAMAILDVGQPVLPSGMVYARALLNIYMMSGSVWVFGESEWAFRLPSAVVGSLAGLAAFFLGRRFLPPQFNLAFVASITLLPSMIAISQTARMYAFFVTCMIWFGACVFRWERDQRISSLILALIVWFICLHFQRLAILAIPLFLFPGFSRQSWSQLVQGAVACATAGLLYKLYANWITRSYPQGSGQDQLPPALEDIVPQTPFHVIMSGNEWLAVASIAVIFGMIVLLLIRCAVLGDRWQAVPVLLTGAGLLALAALQYHVGAILLMLGGVFWLRVSGLSRTWLLAPLLLAALLIVVHLGLLHSTGLYPGRRLIGAVVGTPSVWPVLRFLMFSPFAGIVYSVVLFVVLTRFAGRRRMPMHVLFFAMAVWAPLLIIGVFDSYIPERYASGQVGVFLLCTFAGVAYLAHQFRWLMHGSRLSRGNLLVLVLVVVAVVNPIALARTVNPSYDRHPDHKGAASFIQSVGLGTNSVLIAEDVLQQTYYLGKVDYWLREIDNANRYTIVREGLQVDIYTATPLIGDGVELQAILDRNLNKDVYVIGSGENFVDGGHLFRGRGIADVLASDRMEIVFIGRDNRTKVWKLVR